MIRQLGKMLALFITPYPVTVLVCVKFQQQAWQMEREQWVFIDFLSTLSCNILLGKLVKYKPKKWMVK